MAADILLRAAIYCRRAFMAVEVKPPSILKGGVYFPERNL